jgi:isoamylase
MSSAHRLDGALWVFADARDTVQAFLVTGSRSAGNQRRVKMQRKGECWWAELADAHDGMLYHLEVDGAAPVLDPYAHAVRRDEDGFRCVLRTRPWPTGTPVARRLSEVPWYPVVYEAHVRGFGRTFEGARQHLHYLADLGIDVIELMPIHPFDDRGNYWGYMPLVWGAVHEPFAGTGNDPIDELAAFVAAAHEHGIAVWVDVVFNHTGEDGAGSGASSWRALADDRAYRFSNARYTNDSGCGNDIDPSEPEIQRLVLTSLERYASVGIDGFRFDLASLLTRDGGGLVRRIGDWAESRDVTLVAEAWDLAAYQVGDGFPDRRWAQWNDRFREDVRGFLRGEPGLVPSVMRRIAGSPDLFHGDAWRSVNFVTAHDGLTMHDLTVATSDHHRSWDCGPAMRMQYLKQLRSPILLLSAGRGDVRDGRRVRPHAARPRRTRTTSRRHRSAGSTGRGSSTLERPARLRAARLLADAATTTSIHEHVRVYGRRTDGPTPTATSRARSPGSSGDGLIVMANAWWEPLRFRVERAGSVEVVELASCTLHPTRRGRSSAIGTPIRGGTSVDG